MLLLGGVVLASGHGLTKVPHGDEGDLASAAASLLDHGRIAFPMSYIYSPSVRHEYYVLPPFYPAFVAAWFAAAGRSLEAYRLLHVLWFVLLVVSWTRMVRAATGTSVALVIAAGLFALNYDLINLSVSRYDIVCAALNAAALASFAGWRRHRFGLALFIANGWLAISALTHPFAMFGLAGCLATFVAAGDWRCLRVGHVLVAVAPYVIAFGVWALIIDGNWSVLLEQVAMQRRQRGIDLSHPLTAFIDDFTVRWWQLFAGWREGVPLIMRVKTLFLLLWGVVPFLVFRRVPDGTLALRIGIVAYTVVTLVVIPFTDSIHVQIYNLHVIAGFTALTAIVGVDMWESRPALRRPLVAVVAGICLFGVLGIGFRVSRRDLQREYVPVQGLLARELREGETVIAPGEMGFGLGFERHVREDPGLVSVEPGAMPRFIVESEDQFGSASYGLRCRVGSLVHDTTAYAALPLRTPRAYYRVLARVAPEEGGDRGGQLVVHMAPKCGAVRGSELRR